MKKVYGLWFEVFSSSPEKAKKSGDSLTGSYSNDLINVLHRKQQTTNYKL